MEDEEEKFFTVDDTAKRWKVTKQMIYSMVEDGRLAKVKIGKFVRIKLSTIEDYEKENFSGDLDG